MNDELQNLRSYIAQFRVWIDKHAAPAIAAKHGELIRTWREELSSAERLLEHKPEIPIAMLGPSQQGKSTLINALLESPILAVGGAIGACTCVITSIHHTEMEDYSAEIYFITLAQWRHELSVLKENLHQKAGSEDTAADSQELQEQIEAATEKIKAVYQIDDIKEFLFPTDRDTACRLPDNILQHMNSGSMPLKIEGKSPISLRNAVRRYMVGRNQHHDAQYWPLIREIRIRGKFPILRNGVVLVDLPGLDDPNPAREQVTRNYLSDARYLWMVCNSQTGIARVFTQMLRNERLLHKLFLEGRLPAFAVIATRADEFDISAVLQQMGRDPDEQYEMTDVLKFRNNEVSGVIKHQLRDIAHAIIDRAASQEFGETFLLQVDKVPTFPVGSAAYLHAVGFNKNYQGYKLSETDTNIPALKSYLEDITVEQSFRSQVEAARRRLELLRQTAYSFFFSKTQDLRDQGEHLKRQWQRLQDTAARSSRETAEQTKINLATAKDTLSLQCRDFHAELERLDKKAIQNIERAFATWQQINWRTLQAAIRNNGEWFSRYQGKAYDLNEDISSAFLDLIPLIWERFFSEILAKVIADLSNKCLRDTNLLVSRINGEIDMLEAAPLDLREVLQNNMKTDQETYRLRTEELIAALADQVKRTRQTLASGINGTVVNFMLPAYGTAKNLESGKGIKQKMLDVLVGQVRNKAGHLFVIMRRDLADGISLLQGAINKSFDELAKQADVLVNRIKSNVEVSTPPTPGELEAYRLAAAKMPAELKVSFILAGNKEASKYMEGSI